MQEKEPAQVVVIGKDEELPPDALLISIDSEYQAELNKQDSNGFCEELAEELRGSPKDPLKLRNLLEQQKLKIVQELNQLRRLIDLARTNNYSLYKAYRLLKLDHNADVLLTLLTQDINTTSDPSVSEVLQVIEKCLA